MRAVQLAALACLLAAAAASAARALDINEDVTLPDAEVGTPYRFQLEAEEGCLPYRFSFGSGRLPPGLTVSEQGELSGTPTEAGVFEFYVAVDDSPTCASPQSQGRFTLRVLPDLAVATSALPRAVPGAPYEERLEAANPEEGWPLRWSVRGGALPEGLALAEDGTLSGVPAAPGAFVFVARVEEPFRRFGERELSLAVAFPLALTGSAPPGEVGLRYRLSPAVEGGLPPVAFALTQGDLPAGLALDTSTGAVAGVPRAPGTFPITLAATDASGQSASLPLSLRIAPRLALLTSALPAARVGRAYASRLRARGGVGSVRFRLVGGRLPRGLRLRAAGVVAGVPRQAGSFPVEVEARDRLGATARRALLLTVRS